MQELDYSGVGTDVLGDSISSLELVDQMGDDLSVVNAARVSYGKRSVHFEERDAKLIHYLMRHRHGTPFEHVEFTFRVRAPLFVVHQWERHRMASYNEESGRYIELRPDFFTPKVDRAGIGEDADDSIEIMREHWQLSFDMYKLFLSRGMDKELARIVLPASLYKEFWWTTNARALMNFISLRTEGHAQEEIRKFGDAVEAIFLRATPAIAGAFVANERIAP